MANSLRIKRGDTQNIPLSTPSHVLTGGTVYFTIKLRDQVNVIDLTDSNAILKKTATITGDNSAIIGIAPTDTEDIPPGDYVFDIQLIKDGAVTTIYETTTCEIVADVTQRRS